MVLMLSCLLPGHPATYQVARSHYWYDHSVSNLSPTTHSYNHHA